MKKIVILLLIPLRLLGQDVNNQSSLFRTKEFMRKVCDLQPFDSIAELTTLSKDLPLARFKYSTAYFSITILQLRIKKNNYSYSNFSYIPYSSLPLERRTLIHEKFFDGRPNRIDIDSIYAVYNKVNLVTYVEIREGKVSGIKSYYSQGSTDYMHQFRMDNVDNKAVLAQLNMERPLKSSVSTSDIDGLFLARNFVKFSRDSLPESGQKAIDNFSKLRKKLLCSDTLDLFTTYYSMEHLKRELTKFPIEELSVKPYLDLSKKQKASLVVGNENDKDIYVVMHKKEVITYLCLSGNKVKYFLAFKNLKGQYVFIPYGYACPQIRRT